MLLFLVPAGMSAFAYFGEPGASSRKDAFAQAHLASCVKGEDAASGVIWPVKCQRIYDGEHPGRGTAS